MSDERLFILRLAPEIALKSRRTRIAFNQRLRKNLADARRRNALSWRLRPYGNGLLLACPPEVDPVPVLTRTFGIETISPVVAECRAELSAILEAGQAAFRERVAGRRYAVRARRRGGATLASPLIERELGRALNPGATVDLTNPDITVHVDVDRQRARLYSERIPAEGGLPAGIQGSALALVSGGFDSAVAAHRMMRRGVALDFLFCNLAGQAHERMVVQVIKVLTELWGFGLRPRMHVVDFAPLAAALRDKVDPTYAQVVLKRLMYRAADQLAAEGGYAGVVTGDSIGQVSTQTLANLPLLDELLQVPVLRPLIGVDKQWIIAESRRIGTAALSQRIQEYCALNVGPHTTKARAAELARQEGRIAGKLLQEALEARRCIDVTEVDAVALRAAYLFLDEVPQDAVLLDCQPPQHYRYWHAPGAIPVDPTSLQSVARQLDKRRPCLAYCGFGMIAPQVAEMLQQAGYEAYAFRGGVAALQRALAGQNQPA